MKRVTWHCPHLSALLFHFGCNLWLCCCWKTPSASRIRGLGAGGVRAAAAGRRSQENKDAAQADEEDEEPGVGQGLLVEFSPT